MVKRDFKGIWIPKDIWLNENLTMQEKLFLVEIDSLDNEHGCYAANNYFADFFGISKGRCSQIINSLAEKGFIKIHMKRNGKQIIKREIKVVRNLNTPLENEENPVKYSKAPSLENDNTPLENAETPIKYSKEPPLENDKENNTKSNNTKSNNTKNNTKSNNTTNNTGVSRRGRFYEENGFGMLTPFTIQKMEEWVDDLTEKGASTQEADDLIVKALEIAVANNAKKWAYVNGILTSWYGKGLYTASSVEAQEKLYQANKTDQREGGYDAGIEF